MGIILYIMTCLWHIVKTLLKIMAIVAIIAIGFPYFEAVAAFFVLIFLLPMIINSVNGA